MLQGLGNLAGIMQQAQQFGERMRECEAKLQRERYHGASGGGMVEVEVSGTGDVVKLAIDPALTANNEREMLEDLIPAAVNHALTRMREGREAAMRDLLPQLGPDGTNPLQMPGISNLLNGILNRPK